MIEPAPAVPSPPLALVTAPSAAVEDASFPADAAPPSPRPVLILTDYAEMERYALGDRGVLAHYTETLLRENGLSYRDQEGQTGVPAALVYRMAYGGLVTPLDVHRFARTAGRMTQREDARLFWTRLEARLANLLGVSDAAENTFGSASDRPRRAA
jgi:hypothetical protein